MSTEKKVIKTATDLRREILEFKETLKGKTQEELEALEQKSIKEIDENDAVVAKTMIKLPSKGIKAAGAAIVHFLNKQSVQWQYAGSMLAQIAFWESNPKEIAYPMLDQTLNMLGGLQYTGKADWERVIAIDSFIGPIKEEYGAIRTNVFILAEKHNAIMEVLGIVKPFNGDSDPGDVKA